MELKVKIKKVSPDLFSIEMSDGFWMSYRCDTEEELLKWVADWFKSFLERV